MFFVFEEKLLYKFPLAQKAAEKMGSAVTSADQILKDSPLFAKNRGEQCFEANMNTESRISAKEAVSTLGKDLDIVTESGPLFLAYTTIKNPENPTQNKRIAIVAQNNDGTSKTRQGSHTAGENFQALAFLKEVEAQNIPVLSIGDTPGGSANEEANLEKQSQAISHLISRCTELGVPHLHLNLGKGGSGGVIALYGHLSYIMQDAWFNTIDPRALAKIQNEGLTLSECIEKAGIDPLTLVQAGVKDGIVNLIGDKTQIERDVFAHTFQKFVWSGIETIEESLANNTIPFFQTLDNVLKQSEFINYSLLFLTETQNSVLGNTEEERKKTLEKLVATLSKKRSADTFDSLNYWFQTGIGSGKKREVLALLAKRFSAYQLMQERLEDPERLKVQIRTDYRENGSEENGVKREKNAELAKEQMIQRWIDAIALLKTDILPREIRLELKKYGESFLGRVDTKIDKVRGGAAKLLKGLITDLTQRMPGKGKEAAEDIVDAILWHTVQSFGRELPQLLKAFESMDIKALIKRFPKNIEKDKLLYWLEHFDDVFRGKLPQYEACHQISEDCFDEGKINLRKIKTIDDFVNEVSRKFDTKRLQEINAWLGENENHRKTLWRLLQGKVKLTGIHECLAALFYYAIQKVGNPSLDLQQDIFPEVRAWGGAESLINFWHSFEDLIRKGAVDTLMAELPKEDRKVTIDTILQLPVFKNADFKETNADLICANPRNFPGLDASIKKAIESGKTASGIITGEIEIRDGEERKKIQLIVSNAEFQAGAIDMAAAKKVQLVLEEAAKKGQEVIMFLNSAGMNTKEGANSLESMPIMNGAVAKYHHQTGRKPLIFGFGNVTGGIDASIYNSPYVERFMLEMTNQLFAGQLVVPYLLPLSCRLSNLTTGIEGKMEGLVQNPFIAKIREKLRAELSKVMPEIVWAENSIEDVISHHLFGKEILGNMLGKKSIESKEQERKNFKKIAVINRGEIAVASMKAAKSLGKEVIQCSSTADLSSYMAQYARDNGVQLLCVGGDRSNESYLNIKNIIAALKMNGVDAVMVGYGFLSENRNFAELCIANGITPIMPQPEVLDMFGDKEKAKKIAIEAEVPPVPGGEKKFIEYSSEVQKEAASIKYPILIKAVSGGGGKGMRIVRSETELAEACKSVASEAAASFGNAEFYLEKYLESVRHIEVQIMADKHGGRYVLDMRDCSMQKNHQKIIEESAVIPENIRKKLEQYSQQLMKTSGYDGLGTIEFLYDQKTQEVYFIEVNPRIQVEREVSRQRFKNADFLEWQIRIAQGEKIDEKEIERREDIGHVLQVRINAVNPKDNFNVSPGIIKECNIADIGNTEGITIHTSIGEGGEVTSFYDSNVALIIVEGKDRNEAIKKAKQALDRLKIQGIYTNAEFLKALLSDQKFLGGEHDTAYIDRLIKTGMLEKLPAQDIPQKKESDIELQPGQEIITTPLFGFCSLAPRLGEKPFVEEGAIIYPNDQLAMVEAMKMYCPVTYNGGTPARVVEVLIGDNSAIENGTALFIVEPIKEIDVLTDKKASGKNIQEQMAEMGW